MMRPSRAKIDFFKGKFHETAWGCAQEWYQRCYLIHDRPKHLRRRQITYLRRRALGDLFVGPYPIA